MGDRRMAEIKTEDGSLYVYTHWQGYEFDKMAVEAVRKAAPRITDTPYAVRIIVDQLTKGGRDQETGYGLLLTPACEDEYNKDKPSIIIDLVAQTLTIRDDNPEPGLLGSWPFRALPEVPAERKEE